MLPTRASSRCPHSGSSTPRRSTAFTGSDATCNAAINRFCRDSGYGTGFGPAEHSGDYLLVVCTPEADVLETSYPELSEHIASCDGSTERSGHHCSEAFHRWCRAQGYDSGYGPLENSGDLAYAACLGGW